MERNTFEKVKKTLEKIEKNINKNILKSKKILQNCELRIVLHAFILKQPQSAMSH